MSAHFSRLLLLPVGDTPSAPMRDLARDLEILLGLQAHLSVHRVPLPDEAWDPRRGQTLAPRVLYRLRAARTGSDALLLGVANADLFAPGLSFVFGQADILAGVATISAARLYPAFYGSAHDPATFRRRMAIEGVHEVGHLLGLRHCLDRRCVMFFSSTMTDSDEKGPLFCAECRAFAHSAVGRPPRPSELATAADGPAEPPL